MLTVRSLSLLLALGALSAVEAAPQSRNRGGKARTGGRKGQQQQQATTAFEQAQQVPQGVSTATDGSTILDTTVMVNGLPLRFKVSAPADQFTADSGVDGATQDANAPGDLVLAFNSSRVSFTGVSGGSLLLSGFFMPAHMSDFGSAAAGQESQVLLNCGGLEPQVAVSDANAAALATTRVHFQSTQQELTLLQPAIPAAVQAYEQIVAGQGLDADAIGALQTVDNSPNGGHCEFDEQDFVSGVQLMADSFSAIVQGGDGNLVGTNVNVLNPVVGNEDLQFSGAS
ncbi:hypothetical protein K449DRAFT_408310 [Hypoxylon sp. EC38]|nr:hypothetical protein K449DRAFT_408310 [Hypoxylon sp. EC38]